MALQVTEFFGHAPLDPAATATVSVKRCPFVNGPCIKPNHGACSVRQLTQKDPVICCPNRMYQHNFRILAEISTATFGESADLVRPSDVGQRILTGSMTGNEVAVFGRYWGQELPLPRPQGASSAESRKYYVDWILAKLDRDGTLTELTAVEVQTVDTTGNYSDQVRSFFARNGYKDDQGRMPGYSNAGYQLGERQQTHIASANLQGPCATSARRSARKASTSYVPSRSMIGFATGLGGNLHEYHPSTGTITFRSYELGPTAPPGYHREMSLSWPVHDDRRPGRTCLHVPNEPTGSERL